MKNYISFNQIILATVLLGLHAPAFSAASDSSNSFDTAFSQVSGNRESSDDESETAIPTQQDPPPSALMRSLNKAYSASPPFIALL